MFSLDQFLEENKQERKVDRAVNTEKAKETGGLEIGNFKITGKDVLGYLLGDYTSILKGLDTSSVLSEVPAVGESLNELLKIRDSSKQILDSILGSAQSYLKPKDPEGDDTLSEIFGLLRAGQSTRK